MDHSDVSLYVMTPEYGAATQLEKIDMLDFADVVALNKFDKRGAQDALRDVRKQYQRNHQQFARSVDQMPVVGTIASQFNDPGTHRLYRSVIDRVAEKCGVPLDSTFGHGIGDSEKIFIIPPERTRYLAEIAATRGDPVDARRLTAEFRRFNPDPTWVTQLELMTSCRSTGPAGVAWEKETAAHPDEVFYLAQALATGGAHWGCSEAAVRQVLGSDSTAANYQRAALLMLQSMLVAQRRFGEAKDLIDGAIRQGVTDARALYVVDAVAGAPFETQARAALDALGDGNRTLQAPKLWFEVKIIGPRS